MTEFPLSDGRIALISPDDYEAVAAFKWSVMSIGYARTYVREGGVRRPVVMHRFIKQCTHGDGKIVDHINGNRLDNRRENLRVCTAAENARNSKLCKINTSGYKGVHWREKEQRWVAQIKFNMKRLHLGTFKSAAEAYEAYCAAAIKLHGEFARI